MQVLFYKELKDYTTFGLPGRASVLQFFENDNDLRNIFRTPFPPTRYKVIGSGSNLLFCNDFDGTLLKSTDDSVVFEQEDENTVIATAGAGLETDKLCSLAAEKGLWGLENLSGIPGSVGAAPVQNVGAYGVEASDVVIDAKVFDTRTGQTLTIKKDEMEFGYRDSMFKRAENRDRYIVLSVRFRLWRQPKPQLAYGPLKSLQEITGELTPEIIRQKVIEIRDSKLPRVNEVGSAGSFFKNPVVKRQVYENLLAKYPDIPGYLLPDEKVKIPAAWLIDRAGLKGASEGGAAVWQQQPLVIVNSNGTATAEDVLRLEKRIIATVKEQFNVELSPEVEHIYQPHID